MFITICSFHSSIALEASVILVNTDFIVRFMTCMLNIYVNATIQVFTRIIGSYILLVYYQLIDLFLEYS